MTESFDAVIVGARCAGAPLARFLARGGAKVVLIDASDMPSDQPMSTHFIQPYGMHILDELGLGDRVRAIAPPVDVFINGCEDRLARLRWPAGTGGSCPRRIDLDPLLIDGAREVGAEVRLRCKAVDLMRDGNRVTGVVVEQAGERRELRAGVVVGADGRNSTIADLVGAEEYYGYDNPRFAYWAYWPRPSWYGSDARYEGAAIIAYRGRDFVFSFPTNRDQLLIGCGLPGDDAARPKWRADPAGMLRARLSADDLCAPLIEGATPVGKVIGAIKMRYFFKRAAGPGWALVGDSGLFKDPTAGLGISDALRDARALAAAISQGGDAALERYWRERDVASIELYQFTRQLGEVDYNNPLNQLVFEKLCAKPELIDRLRDVVERRVSPFDAFRTSEVLGWTLGALVRGRFGVVKPFLVAGKRQAYAKRELALRRRLATPQLPA